MLADVARRAAAVPLPALFDRGRGQDDQLDLFLAAGGEVAYWLGGFDDARAAQQPAMQTILAAIEEALEQGDARLDLGAGAQDYKYRFADGEDELRTVTIVPRGPRYALARAALLPDHARRAVTTRIPDPWRERLRRSLARR